MAFFYFLLISQQNYVLRNLQTDTTDNLEAELCGKFICTSAVVWIYF